MPSRSSGHWDESASSGDHERLADIHEPVVTCRGHQRSPDASFLLWLRQERRIPSQSVHRMVLGSATHRHGRNYMTSGGAIIEVGRNTVTSNEMPMQHARLAPRQSVKAWSHFRP